MKPYIFGKRNGIHIIDIRETVKGLLRSKKLLTAVVAQGQDVLIVGTKRQARNVVEKQSSSVGMPYVIERWLGGTLTNFKTIRSRLARLEELEEIERTEKAQAYSKKAKAKLQRERRKIQRNLEGIRKMTRLPGALAIIDVKREHIAVKEARKLGIPTVCLVDTDSDPGSADILIPGNDDNMRAIELIVGEWCKAIEEGKRARPAPGAGEEAAGGRRDRSRRSQRLSTSEIAEREVAAESKRDEAEETSDASEESEPTSGIPVEAGAASRTSDTTA